MRFGKTMFYIGVLLMCFSFSQVKALAAETDNKLNHVKKSSTEVEGKSVETDIEEGISVEDRLEEMESKLDDLKDETKLQIKGFFSQGWMKSTHNNYLGDSENGNFEYNELGLNFSTDLTDKLRFGMQLFSRDLGEIGNNKIAVDWAYGDYRCADWFGLRFGRIKIPIGLYNETRDVDSVRTFTMLPQGVYDEKLRDASIAMNGVSIYGNLDGGSAGDLDYILLGGGNNYDPNSGLGKSFADMGFSLDKMGITSAAGASLKWNMPIEGLVVGISGTQSRDLRAEGISAAALVPAGVAIGTPVSSEAKRFSQWVHSVEYTAGDFTFAAEHFRMEGKLAIEMGGFPAGSNPVVGEGAYTSLAYRFNDYFELGAYYSVYYPDKADKTGKKLVAQYKNRFEAWQKDICVSARFDITENWLIKLEAHAIDGTGQVSRTDNPHGLDKTWGFFVIKTTFEF